MAKGIKTGGRKKGSPKSGGRQKGTPNKTTASIREAIASEWQKYQESGLFAKDINALTPQARLLVMEKLAQYITPKMKNLDMEISAESSENIVSRLSQLVAQSSPKS